MLTGVLIDRYANRYNLLRRRHAAAPGAECGDSAPPPLGNQDWGLAPSGLPQ